MRKRFSWKEDQAFVYLNDAFKSPVMRRSEVVPASVVQVWRLLRLLFQKGCANGVLKTNAFEQGDMFLFLSLVTFEPPYLATSVFPTPSSLTSLSRKLCYRDTHPFSFNENKRKN